jgi:5-methylcytosine-specific restriction endonuclease McrA
MFKAPGQRVWNGDEKARKSAIDKRRPSARERGYDKDWYRFRDAFLTAFPRCCHPGCAERATEVDHIISVRDRPDLRLSQSNCRPFCKPHHSKRTASDQGFARR